MPRFRAHRSRNGSTKVSTIRKQPLSATRMAKLRRASRALVEGASLPAYQCGVHKQMVGGGFGRRGQTDYARQAVAMAKQMPGTPIKLLWSREEDMQHGKYHPITQCKLTGAFDAANNLTALRMRR